MLVKCGHTWTLGGVIWLLIGGVVIGLLGKFVAPGNRDKIPFWLTVLCGVVGIFLGNWLYVDVFDGRCSTGGIDWLRHIVQVLAAAIVVMVAATLTGRSRSRRLFR
ncbi:MAG: GlsB/YeaQ/YmgE family stress response membrane protein [Nocardioides sp.]|nr:GlsB/YeaQ/YmgE family stress response membrane protein [Nocardioides sp.]